MKEILQGMLIGIGKIIPGVSGSLIAISLGVYERAISCITNFFKDIKSNIKYLGLLGLGVIISMIIVSKLIVFMLENYYVITILFFVGLILGSGTKMKRSSKKYNYISLISFSVVLGLSLISKNHDITFTNSLLQFVYMFFIGIIEAATMIIPGISGTAVMMLVGAYDTIIQLYSNLFSISSLIYNFSIILPLIVGIVIGTYLVSKLINYLFIYYNNQTYKAITGFLYGTVVYMITLCLNNFSSVWDLIIGTGMCFIGMLLIKKVNHFL